MALSCGLKANQLGYYPMDRIAFSNFYGTKTENRISFGIQKLSGVTEIILC